MSANIENSIKLMRPRHDLGKTHRVLPQRLLAIVEVDREFVGLEHFDGGWVERGLAALGRGDGHFDAGVVQDLPGVCEFGLFLRVSRCLLDVSVEMEKRTRNQPVGWSWPGILSTEVRTTRTLGAMFIEFKLIRFLMFDVRCSMASTLTRREKRRTGHVFILLRSPHAAYDIIRHHRELRICHRGYVSKQPRHAKELTFYIICW